MQRIQSDFSVQQFSVPFSGHNIGISINRTRGSEPSADIIPEYDFFQQWGGFQFKCQGSYYNYTMDRVGDPDLSGIGVTISFLITSVFTLVLLLYGFRRHLIVDTFTNPFDKAVFHWLGSKTVHLSDSRKRMREKQAFQAALTALSDQQLVVGIAVLLAGISNCSLTIYGLRNLVAVTWLTAFVHLGTLLVVEKELRRNKPLRIIKAIAMLVMLVLIVYATVLYMFVDATTRGLQVQARYFYDHGVDRLGVGGIPSLSAFLDSNGFAVGYFLAYGRKIAALSIRTRIVRDGTDFASLSADAVVISFLFYFYCTRALGLLRTSPSRRMWLFENVLKGAARWGRIPTSISEDFDYGLYRQLREQRKWEAAQTKALKWRSTALPLSSRFQYPIYAYKSLLLRISLLWASVPQTATTSIAIELLWVTFLFLQALSRFTLCWILFKPVLQIDGFQVDDSTEQWERRTEEELMNWGMGQVVAVVFVFMPALVWIQVMFGPDPIVTTAHDGNRSPEPNSLRLVVIDTISNSIPAVTLTATGTDNTLGGTTLNGTWRSQTSSNDSGILNRKYSMDEFYQSQQYRRRSKVVVYLTLLGATILITGQILSRLGQTVRSDEWTFSRLAYPNSGWETAKYVESKLDQKALTRNMLITMIASFLQLAFVSVIVLNRIWFTVGCILQVVDDFRALRSRCIHRQDGAVEERKSESACGIA